MSVTPRLLNSPDAMHHYHYHLPNTIHWHQLRYDEISLHICTALKTPYLNSVFDLHSYTTVSSQATLNSVTCTAL
jgi:hypothetical protein